MIPVQDRQRLIDAEVTLDGKPARVIGRLNDFGTVAQIGRGGVTADYAWETIRRVIDERDGRFAS